MTNNHQSQKYNHQTNDQKSAKNVHMKDETRYKVQELMIGSNGQKKLENSIIAIVGVGALGSLIAELASRAGVGKILLFDYDSVSLSNLHRQFLFDESDIGKPKAYAAIEKLKMINSKSKYEARLVSVDSSNIEEIYNMNPNIVFECSDNMKTKIITTEYFTSRNIPVSLGTAAGSIGYAFITHSKVGNIFSVFPNVVNQDLDVDSCSTLGTANNTTSLISVLQWNLGMHYLLNDEILSSVFYVNGASVGTLKRKKIADDSKNGTRKINIAEIINDNNDKDHGQFKKLCGGGFLIKKQVPIEKLSEVLSVKKINYLDFGDAVSFDEFIVTRNSIIIKVDNYESAHSLMDKLTDLLESK